MFSKEELHHEMQNHAAWQRDSTGKRIGDRTQLGASAHAPTVAGSESKFRQPGFAGAKQSNTSA
jgi:hypothetical protein